VHQDKAAGRRTTSLHSTQRELPHFGGALWRENFVFIVFAWSPLPSLAICLMLLWSCLSLRKINRAIHKDEERERERERRREKDEERERRREKKRGEKKRQRKRKEKERKRREGRRKRERKRKKERKRKRGKKKADHHPHRRSRRDPQALGRQ